MTKRQLWINNGARSKKSAETKVKKFQLCLFKRNLACLGANNIKTMVNTKTNPSINHESTDIIRSQCR